MSAQEALDRLIRDVEAECVKSRPSKQRLCEAVKRAQDEALWQFSSALYWENRYAEGGNSGDGSGGILAEWKAEFLNEFVANRHISSVVEFGCGDGRQLALAEYPCYLGLDPSPTALELCRERFQDDKTKMFAHPPLHAGAVNPRELALSLDVIFHLVEDDVYEKHLNAVFAAASRFVILYTTDSERVGAEWTAPHVRHRPVPKTVTVPGISKWKLVQLTENPYPGLGGSDFHVYAQ